MLYSGPSMTHLIAAYAKKRSISDIVMRFRRRTHQSLFVLSGLSHLERLERVGELESMSDQRLQVDEASRDEGDGHGVVAGSVSKRGLTLV
jgi:hypothetical protein